MLQSTKGRANEFVSNRRFYLDAMEILDREYGNKHVIMNLLIDNIKKLPAAKKGDFNAFGKISHEANAFRYRLLEMGHRAESEYSYILKELGSKLCQKWLDSMGTKMDRRRVEDLVA